MGWVTVLFDSQRAGISVVLLLFLIGGVLLLRIDEEEGRRLAQTPLAQPAKQP